MGTGASKNSDSSHGGQLYVSLKMENLNVRGDLIPHVYGSLPITGSWEPTESLSMARESASMWVLSFIVPPNHETLDFKFLLKSKYNARPCMVEEGPSRQFIGGALQEGDARPALFNVGLDEEEVLEYRVFIEVDIVSPFDLAASWRAYLENLQPSRVRGIPDVSINVAPETGMENSSGSTLELDLEHYVVPAPSSIAGALYAANLAETPRSLLGTGDFSKIDASTGGSYGTSKAGDCSNSCKDMDAVVSDPCKLLSVPGFDSKSVGTFSPVPKQESQKGLFVDRGVGSPRLIKSAGACIFTFDRKLDCETKKGMPAAAGAVAAAAIADQMLGPKEDSRLAIVLVGLPARGKTFTAAKLTRYLRWLGHETKHFNVGKYRRLKLGTNQTADFFRGDNPEGMEARNEVAALAMDDMISWMQEGGQVGIFDATNSTRSRRNMLMKMAEGKCKIIFLETICNDAHVIERNIRLKIQQSPDYAEEPDFEAGMQDFKERLANYEKVYEPVEEGSYIKMIDMASGQGGQIQVNNIGGYLPGRIVFFLVNTHLTPRPILLTRHGESCDNVRGRIGGDAVLRYSMASKRPQGRPKLKIKGKGQIGEAEAGELYSKKLAEFIEKRLKSERTASIWTSTLQRTILTASPIVGFPKIQWRALEEINAGVCDGMTYAEIKKNMPEEYESRKKDKLRYRYPRGESYLDVIQRLEPVLIELERQRAPVVIISHQAVLRALYAYFADRPLQEIPHIEVPLHTIIEIQMGVTGVQEKRYKLMD
ncbi:6-phosphofructo-2-kinase/fructose-2,6-bisphosphatase-like isoform X3 [Zingiber officinale]|uniref:6-phosphofructo-2-kinase/fructose-2, 6-bisphosphatase-like isoform X3 n=1 Tax=Zingiber officinale TaxID=94328 RepID=UPI001C4B50AE|nr:6-phosphofructo-2-kinase/fructose-2,6-bisphosphatase-like isoform X3 [Zingiber officinale]